MKWGWNMIAHAALAACLALVAADTAKGSDQEAGGTPARRIVDVVYANTGGESLHINLVLPEPNPDKPLPVVVWIHGGGWAEGNYKANRAASLVEHGYAAASIQYQFSQVARFPAQIHQCKAAVRFLRAHAREYNLDPARIGVWGASAGGHLAALLGTSGGVKELEGTLGCNDESSRVQAVCDFFGPAKFLPEEGEPQPVLQVYYLVPQFFGGSAQEKADLYRLGSPVTHASKDDPPFLIVHGDIDQLVPIGQSELLYDALRRAGADAAFIRVRNGNHGFSRHDQYPRAEQIEQKVLEFFDKHLKG